MIFSVFKSTREAGHPEASYSLAGRNGKRMIFITQDCVYFDTIDLSADAREQEIFSSNFVSTTQTVQYDVKHLDQLIRAHTKHRHYFCSIVFEQSIKSIAVKPYNRRSADEAPTNILEIESTDTIRAITESIERGLLPIVRQVLK